MADWKLAAPESTAYKAGYDLADVAHGALEQDGDVNGYRFTGGRLWDDGGKTLEFSNCVFERCTFGELDVGRMSFVDCVFDKCELSNLRITNAAFQRVSFRSCRMTGMECLRCVLMSVLFEECMMDYLSLSETKLDRVQFTDCRLRESLWADVKLPKVRFERADLSRAQWMRTPLSGVNLSSCIISGWNITLFDLRGAKVTAAQVIELSGLLGVEIVS